MTWPPGIVRIDTKRAGQKVGRGTGTVIAQDCVLTALHVVAASEGAPPDHTLEVQVVFADGRESVVTKVVHHDVPGDWAILACITLGAAPRRALKLGNTGRNLAALPHLEWTSFGFPNSEQTGLHMWGAIAGEWTHQATQSTCYQLEDIKLGQMKQAEMLGLANIDQLSGMSGAPILVAEEVVGILRAHATTVVAAYATPIDEIDVIKEAIDVDQAGLRQAFIDAKSASNSHAARSRVRDVLLGASALMARVRERDPRWRDASALKAEAFAWLESDARQSNPRESKPTPHGAPIIIGCVLASVFALGVPSAMVVSSMMMTGHSLDLPDAGVDAGNLPDASDVPDAIPPDAWELFPDSRWETRLFGGVQRRVLASNVTVAECQQVLSHDECADWNGNAMVSFDNAERLCALGGGSLMTAAEFVERVPIECLSSEPAAGAHPSCSPTRLGTWLREGGVSQFSDPSPIFRAQQFLRMTHGEGSDERGGAYEVLCIRP